MWGTCAFLATVAIEANYCTHSNYFEWSNLIGLTLGEGEPVEKGAQN